MSAYAFPAIINLVRARAMVEERLMGEIASLHGLALNDAMFLMHLQRAPLSRLTRVDLARRLHVNPSTVTRMAAPMEKSGYVSREVDARDARLAYVTLTKDGAKLIANVRKTLEGASTRFFRDRWTAAEVETLSALLGRLTQGDAGDLF